VAVGIEDYDLLMEGNKSLLVERNALRERSEYLESKLMKAHASTVEDIAALGVRIKFAKAHTIEVAGAGEKNALAVLKKSLSRTWQSYVFCMSATFEVSEACSHRCLRVSLRSWTTFVG
jgi:hypothetical protein